MATRRSRRRTSRRRTKRKIRRSPSRRTRRRTSKRSKRRVSRKTTRRTRRRVSKRSGSKRRTRRRTSRRTRRRTSKKSRSRSKSRSGSVRKPNLKPAIWSVDRIGGKKFTKRSIDWGMVPFPGKIDGLCYRNMIDGPTTCVKSYKKGGLTLADIYRLGNNAIKKSGDMHHIFIESVKKLGNRLYITTGS